MPEGLPLCHRSRRYRHLLAMSPEPKNLTAFAEITRKAQTEAVELLVAAGKEASNEAAAAVQKAANDATKAAKKAAAAYAFEICIQTRVGRPAYRQLAVRFPLYNRLIGMLNELEFKGMTGSQYSAKRQDKLT